MEVKDIGLKATKSEQERKRIPMSTPVRKLEVPEIPGYHLHWFMNTSARVQRAIEGGYEFVDEREVRINSVALGGDSASSGNTDMGSRVTVLSGSELDTDGQPARLVLMKIKLEWYEEDQKLNEDRNERVAEALRGGTMGAEKDASGDTRMRYVDKTRTAIPDLFIPKRR
jgi:hypothetical protein